jgi:hypothetical protein
MIEFPAFMTSSCPKTPIDCTSGKGVFSTKFTHTLHRDSLSTWFDRLKSYCLSLVIGLFQFRCPCAIALTVTFIVIYSLQAGVILIGFFVGFITFMHIIEKYIKIIPLTADRDIPLAVVMKCFVFRVITSLFHICPNPVKHSLSHIVSGTTLLTFFRLVSAKIVNTNIPGVSTAALTFKECMVPVTATSTDNSPTTKLVTSSDILRHIALSAPAAYTSGETTCSHTLNSATLAFAPPMRSTFYIFKFKNSPFTKFLTSAVYKLTHCVSPLVTALIELNNSTVTSGETTVNKFDNLCKPLVLQGFRGL